MAEFFVELKRRHIYRVGAAYVVVAWALTQGVAILAQVFELPAWIAQPAVVLLAVGFPIALITAWMVESKPHEAVASAVRAKSTTVDWLLFGAVALLIALTGYQQIAPRQTGVDEGREAAGLPGAAISLAVLPFTNLSSDPEQEFFSDGMTDEIMTALAKVQSLRVVARESAFQFKGERNDMRAVGRSLNAQYLINGSVRRAGNRVRITAQLVRAQDGVGLWTDNYDRELTDIFVIQEDIARAIASALRVPLGLQQGELLVSNRSIDPEFYQQYLRAKTLVRSRGIQPLTDAAALLEQVVSRHSNYAPAWALLALAYEFVPQNHRVFMGDSVGELRRVVDATQPKAEAAAQKAIQLDPNLADGYVPLGLVNQRRGKLLVAEAMFSEALSLDPNSPDVLQAQSNLFAGVGRLREALAVKQRQAELDPFVPVFSIANAQVLFLNGQTDAAEAITKRSQNAGGRQALLAQYYAAVGRYRDAADALGEIPSGEAFRPESVDVAMRLLRTAPAPVNTRESLPPLGYLGFVYVYVGVPDRALEVYERNVEGGYFQAVNSAFLWHPSYAPVRKTERFKSYVRRAGMIEYWQAKGWPEQCRPTAGDDFVCN